MKIKVQCPSCKKIKNAIKGNKSFRCCHLEFPIVENIYSKEEVAKMSPAELEEVAKKIANIVTEKVISMMLIHNKEVCGRKK